jgi:hypothetical protein
VNILAILLILIAVYLGAMLALTVASKRRMFINTVVAPNEALNVCDSRMSKFFWKRVNGPGELNCKYRFNLPVKGQKSPVLSFSADPSANTGTDIQIWMSSGTTLYGIVNSAERVVWAKWSLGRTLRKLG